MKEDIDFRTYPATITAVMNQEGLIDDAHVSEIEQYLWATNPT